MQELNFEDSFSPLVLLVVLEYCFFKKETKESGNELSY